MIRCLAKNILLLCTLAFARMFLPCRCLAMSLYIILSILSDEGYHTAQGAVTGVYVAMAEWRLVRDIQRASNRSLSSNTSPTRSLERSDPRLNSGHLHLVALTVTSSLQSGIFYLQHTSSIHAPVGNSNILTRFFCLVRLPVHNMTFSGSYSRRDFNYEDRWSHRIYYHHHWITPLYLCYSPFAETRQLT
jgi:hypothetical protein